MTFHFREPQEFYNILNQSYINQQYGKQEPQEIHIMKRGREYWKQNKEEWFSHNNLDGWYMIPKIYKDCPDQNIRLLLQYDQFNRHPSSLSDDKHYEKYKSKHFRFATALALNMIHNGQYSQLDTHEKVFTLLAIRHKENLTLKYFVLRKIHQELEICIKTDIPLWLRFLNASIMDIDTYKSKSSNYHYSAEKIEQHTYWLDAMRVIQQPIYNRDMITDKQINEIETRMISLMEPLVLQYTQESKKIAVSISGGVDSMVVSSILSKIAKKHDLTIIMLHICYNNRQEVENEISLLKYWAQILDCPLFIRRIDELKRSRDTQFRSMYEEVTRKIRFSFYQYFKCPVILGHNRDDTFENMFSNLAKHIHFDNLAGMLDSSIESDVQLLRPFLTINKDVILKYADTNKIPHLIDSTPPWSDRGKTRDVLMPSIEKFNPNILPGLEEFSQFTSFLYKQWKHSFQVWSKTIPKNTLEDGIIIERDTFFETNSHTLTFWVKLWFELDLPYRPSNKSFHTAIKRIEAYKDNKSNYKIRCSLIKNIVLEIRPNRIRIHIDK